MNQRIKESELKESKTTSTRLQYCVLTLCYGSPAVLFYMLKYGFDPSIQYFRSAEKT